MIHETPIHIKTPVWIELLLFLLTIAPQLKAQFQEQVLMTPTTIDTTDYRRLYVAVDNLSFFKDNEYEGSFVKGYTLPGLWIEPKVLYNPLPNVHLEAGLHMLIYDGANKYPCFSYEDIATWKADQYQKGTHLLPFFRAQVALNKHLDLILGNIYGGAHHKLIEPLYNPEANLTADPEAGVQILLDTKPFTLDSWVNWQSFIFKGDGHKEVFTYGLSSRFRINDESSRYHIYFPFQGVIQHRGGEIDTIYTNSIQTWMNGSVGAGFTWNVHHRKFHRLNLETDLTGFYQEAGSVLPYSKGWAWYMKASADVDHFRFKASYWHNKRFISLFGNQMYSSMSSEKEHFLYIRPKMVTAGMEYSLTLGKGYTLGFDCDIFHHFACDRKDLDGVISHEKTSTSFSGGVFLRINPSFLLKQF